MTIKKLILTLSLGVIMLGSASQAEAASLKIDTPKISFSIEDSLAYKSWRCDYDPDYCLRHHHGRHLRHLPPPPPPPPPPRNNRPHHNPPPPPPPRSDRPHHNPPPSHGAPHHGGHRR